MLISVIVNIYRRASGIRESWGACGGEGNARGAWNWVFCDRYDCV